MRDITPRELESRLAEADRPVLLDVREAWELDIARLEGVVHIPMNEIPERIGELDRNREIVVICRSGARSARVARVLEAQGFASVANLSGGVLGWAEEVDPTMRTY